MGERPMWHGGVAGLRPGDLLLPPCETGVMSTADQLAAMGIIGPEWLDDDRCRRDCVYLTRNRGLARAYGYSWGVSHHSRGALYQVKPIGQHWIDPDLPDNSVECRRARVLAVCESAVVMPMSAYLRAMAAQVKA